MSGSIASIAAYNGTGTQGFGTTDQSGPAVKSVFWNDYDTVKHYVNGFSVSEVSSNKGTITTPETIVFTFDNDIDAISDLTLLVEHSSATPTADLPPWYMSLFVERVEIYVGNQVISTINTSGLIKSFLDSETPCFFKNGNPYTSSLSGRGDEYSTIFKLPIFNTLKNDVDCSYLMGLASGQTLQVKVYPQNLTETDYNTFAGGPSSGSANDGPDFFGSSFPTSFTFRLFSNKCTMTNAERNLLKGQVVPKRTNISQFSACLITPNETNVALTTANPITINCDHFNIYADALYVVAGSMHGGVDGSYGVLGSFNIEVILNSTSYSGILPPQITNNAQSIFNHNDDQIYYYKIPLSNIVKSKDQDFVPLGKYDSIRVVLTPVKDLTVEYSFYNTLSVIATGKTTAKYETNAVTFTSF